MWLKFNVDTSFLVQHVSAMKFWISPEGKKTRTGAHYDVAKEVLAALGVKVVARGKTKKDRGSLMYSADYEGVYAAMFQQGYMRVDERDDSVFIENPNVPKLAYLPRGQRKFIEDAKLAGKAVSYNENRFIETRLGKGNANEIVLKLIG